MIECSFWVQTKAQVGFHNINMILIGYNTLHSKTSVKYCKFFKKWPKFQNVSSLWILMISCRYKAICISLVCLLKSTIRFVEFKALVWLCSLELEGVRKMTKSSFFLNRQFFHYLCKYI